MAFDVSALADHIVEVSNDIYSEMYFGKASMNYFTPFVGIKGTQKLNYFENEIAPILYTCGWSGTTTTSFSQRSITVEAMKNEAAYCIEDLAKKWQGQLMKKGVAQESFPFEDFIVSDISKQLARVNENIVWKGDSDSVTGTYLDLVDGIFKHISDAAGTVVSGLTSSGVTTTVTNVDDKIDEVIDALPTAIKDKEIVIFTSLGNVMLYVRHLYKSNLFHYKEENTNWEVVVPYLPNVKIVGVEAFGSLDRMVATVDGNFIVGVDLLGEEQLLDAWYERKDDQLMMRSKWRIGSQIIFPEYVVYMQ